MGFYTRDGLLIYVELNPHYGWEIWHGNLIVYHERRPYNYWGLPIVTHA